MLDGGQIAAEGTPVQVGERLRTQKHAMFRAMPTPMRVWASTESTAACPSLWGRGGPWLADYGEGHSLAPLTSLDSERPEGAPVLEVDEVWFRYHREGADVLKGLSVTVRPGGALCPAGRQWSGQDHAVVSAYGERISPEGADPPLWKTAAGVDGGDIV